MKILSDTYAFSSNFCFPYNHVSSSSLLTPGSLTNKFDSVVIKPFVGGISSIIVSDMIYNTKKESYFSIFLSLYRRNFLTNDVVR